MGNTLRDFKKDRTEGEILRAAEILFSENGFFQTSIESIAEKAFVSRKTIYNYIASKEDIMVKIVNKRLLSWLENTKVHSQWKLGPREKFVYIYRNLAKEFKKEKKLWIQVILADGINHLRHFSQRAIMKDIIRCFKEILQEGQNEGRFSKNLNPETLAIYLNAVQVQLCLEWVAGWPNSHSLSRKLQNSLDVFYSGIEER